MAGAAAGTEVLSKVSTASKTLQLITPFAQNEVPRAAEIKTFTAVPTHPSSAMTDLRKIKKATARSPQP
jgi:hypothetical protein